METIALAELNSETLLDAPMSKREGLTLAKKWERIKNRLMNLNISHFSNLVSLGTVGRVNAQNKRQIKRNVEKAVGVDISPLLNDDNIRLSLQAAIQNNVNLIKSIQTDYIGRMGKVFQDNIFSGERSTNLITQIKEQGGVTESQAKFLARDQTAKINADLTQIRAEKLSDFYIWSGSLDERERKSHLVLEGMLCKWSDPTVYSDDDGKTWKKRSTIGGYIGHPAKDYGCRCNALPKMIWN